MTYCLLLLFLLLGGTAKWTSWTWKDNTCSYCCTSCWLQCHRDECQVIAWKEYKGLKPAVRSFFVRQSLFCVFVMFVLCKFCSVLMN